MKPFGITIHKEIDNLQMDLIHQILRDYKLKGRRKLIYESLIGVIIGVPYQSYTFLYSQSLNYQSHK